MRRQKLGQTDIEVSALGFGCVQLTAHQSKKNAIAILEHAFAVGITHYDLARSYGFGRAEGIFSGFLRDKRHDVTITTKFGFELPTGLSGSPKFISWAKRILKPFPKILSRAKNHGSSMVKSGAFSPEIAAKSLQKSLRELKTDYIDMLLLHEATLSDVVNEPLIEMLQQQVSKGSIRCFGIASDFEKLGKNINFVPLTHKIVQFNDNVVDQNLLNLSCSKNQGIVTHSIFKPLDALLKAIDKHPETARKFSLQIGIDLCDPKIISVLLLHYALQSNASGVVLFSSMNPTHIKTNARESDTLHYNESQLSGFIEFTNIILQKSSLLSSDLDLPVRQEIIS